MIGKQITGTIEPGLFIRLSITRQNCCKYGHITDFNSYIGVLGSSNANNGVYGSNDSGNGVYGSSDSGGGVVGISTSSYGVYGISSTGPGVRGLSSQNHGAVFRGNKDAGYVDIILQASSDTDTGDNGVIMSDPDKAGSDIFLVSNDAVIVELDNDASENGSFEVWNDANKKILVMLESGQLEVWNGATANNRRLLLDPNGDLFIDESLSEGSDRNRKEGITDISYSTSSNFLPQSEDPYLLPKVKSGSNHARWQWPEHREIAKTIICF